MPTLDARLQANADAALDTAVTALRTRQAGVRGSAGRYRQLHRGGAWGMWEAHRPDPSVVLVWADEYLSGETVPPTPGWQLRGELTDGNGLVWRRIVHVVGPETRRDSPWSLHDEE